MVSSIRQKLAALVISLALLVISLPAPAFALLPFPDVTGVSVVTDGIRTPAGIALDPISGSIYVADTGKNGVLQLNEYGVPIMFFRTEGLPHRVAVAKDGNGSVIVAQGKFVAQYNNNGVESFRLRDGAGLFPFKFATGVAVHPANGNIYVVDAGANEAFIFDSNGIYTGVHFGTKWYEKDSVGTLVERKLELPTDIQISRETTAEGESYNVYILDTKQKDLQVIIFSDAGIYQKSLCKQGAGAGNYGVCQLDFPMGITFDYSAEGVGRVYVSDPYQASVMVIDPAPVEGLPGVYGNFRGYIGEYGTDKGDLVVPSGVAFDAKNSRLIVTNGYGNVTFYAINGGRNPIVRDKLAPMFDIDSLMAHNVSDPFFTITGTSESDQIKVSIKLDTKAKPGPTLYSSDQTTSRWNCTITDLVEGRNQITATARDTAGNTASKTLDIYYTKSLAAGFRVDDYPEVTASTAFTFTGQKLATSTVTTDPLPTTDCDTPTPTTWSCTVPLASEGPNTIRFVVDGTTTVKTITRDTLAPTLQVYALSTGDTTGTQVQNITGTVDDPNLNTVTVKVNDGAVQSLKVTKNVFGFPSTKGVFNTAVSLDRAGTNTIIISAKDKVDNTTTNTRAIALSMAGPSVTVDVEDGTVTRNGSLTVKGVIEPAEAICTINGGPFDPRGTTVQLVPGFNNIVASCAAGDKTSKLKRTVFFGQSVLGLAVTEPKQDLAKNTSSVTISGTVDLATDQLVLTTGENSRNLTLDSGAFSFTELLPTEGVHSFQLTALDGAGNITATTTRNIVADVTPPALSVTYTQSGAGSSISGTVEPGAAVVVTDFSENIIGTVTLGDGSFVAEFPQSYDLFGLMVQATDQALNSTKIGAARPDGDCSGNGVFAIEDASICLDMVAGITMVSELGRAHCDIGPLRSNLVSPNGQIDISDCILIMRKAAGLPPVWW